MSHALADLQMLLAAEVAAEAVWRERPQSTSVDLIPTNSVGISTNEVDCGIER